MLGWRDPSIERSCFHFSTFKIRGIIELKAKPREGACAAPACRDRACAGPAIGADRRSELRGVRQSLPL